jgi:hypothetical protein
MTYDYNIFSQNLVFRAQFGMLSNFQPPIDSWYFTTNGGNSLNSSVPVGSYDFTQWHMYSFSWSATGRTVWLDDHLWVRLPPEVPASPSGSPLIVGGACSQCFFELLNGNVDEMRIYDRELSAEEIRSLYVP